MYIITAVAEQSSGVDEQQIEDEHGGEKKREHAGDETAESAVLTEPTIVVVPQQLNKDKDDQQQMQAAEMKPRFLSEIMGPDKKISFIRQGAIYFSKYLKWQYII